MTHLMPSYLKNAYCGRGAWWNSVGLEVSVFADWQLSNRHETACWHSQGGSLHPSPEVYVRSFFCPFSHCNKTLLHKSSWVVKPGPWSWSQIIFFGDHESDTIHRKLSSRGLVRDLQDKVRTLRAVASLLCQHTRFPLYWLTVLCEWMTRPAWNTWWALLWLCGAL